MNRRAIQGFTLIEVLLALVILSVGLLGIGAMQVVGLRSNSGAVYRSQAILIASEMVERMHSNPVAVSAGTFADIDSNDVDCADSYPSPYCSAYYGTSTHVDAAACTTAEMAAFDIYVLSCGDRIADAWAGNGVTALPGGRMTVGCNATPCIPGTAHVVTVEWADRDQGGASSTSSVSIPFVPNSVPTVAAVVP